MPLHKHKGSRDEYDNYRRIRLLSVPRKVCGRFLMERLMKVTEGKVSREDFIVCSEK